MITRAIGELICRSLKGRRTIDEIDRRFSTSYERPSPLKRPSEVVRRMIPCVWEWGDGSGYDIVPNKFWENLEGEHIVGKMLLKEKF